MVTLKMDYTKKYPQLNKKSGKAKFNRMMSGAGRFGQQHFECGFSTWWFGKDIEQNEDGTFNSNPELCEDYAIFVSTSYHAEATLDDMYKSNCKNW